MIRGDNPMRKRINITLSEDTIALLDRVTDNRSRLIEEAVRHYVKDKSEENLRKRLEQGYRRRAERDLQLAEDWFPLEEEAWRTNR